MERVLVPTTCRRRRSRLNLRAFLASFLVACAGRPSPGALFISGSPTQGNCSFRRRKPTNYSKAPAEAGAAPDRGPQRCSDAGVLFPRAAPFAVIREAINKKGRQRRSTTGHSPIRLTRGRNGSQWPRLWGSLASPDEPRSGEIEQGTIQSRISGEDEISAEESRIVSRMPR